MPESKLATGWASNLTLTGSVYGNWILTRLRVTGAGSVYPPDGFKVHRHDFIQKKDAAFSVKTLRGVKSLLSGWHEIVAHFIPRILFRFHC
jgi:hypothetical protein